MKVSVLENNMILLEEVHNPIMLQTKASEKMVICMRDSGFELKYQHDWYSAKEGKLEPMVKTGHYNPVVNQQPTNGLKKLISVKVPVESDDYSINKVGCLRYHTDGGRQSSVVEPAQIGEYLEPDKHTIIGTSIFQGSKIVLIETI
jgi:hypothetical protein